MTLLLLFKGIAIGIAIAAPVGPVAVLCVRRSLLYGPTAGFAIGLGAILGEVIFGIIATFGIAIVSAVLLQYEGWLRGVGGAFMLALGVLTWRRAPRERPDASSGARLWPAFVSAFALTITNPFTILAYTGIFVAVGVIHRDMTLAATWILIAGIAIGSVVWWGGLTLAAVQLRGRIAPTRFGWLNHASGGLLVLFGMVSLGSLLIA